MTYRLGTRNDQGVFVPEDLTGVQIRMQLRDTAGALLGEITPVVTPLQGTIDATQGYVAGKGYAATEVAWRFARFEVELTYPDHTRQTRITGSISLEAGDVTR